MNGQSEQARAARNSASTARVAQGVLHPLVEVREASGQVEGNGTDAVMGQHPGGAVRWRARLVTALDADGAGRPPPRLLPGVLDALSAAAAGHRGVALLGAAVPGAPAAQRVRHPALSGPGHGQGAARTSQELPP
jgi:hypothetical protein